MAKEYTLPNLPYEYNALEPVISKEIMELHHKKHHQGYVTNLNAALQKYAEAEAKGDLSAMIALQPAIRFNGGGHINHSIFWTNLIPKGEAKSPKGELEERFKTQFGSFDKFVEKFNSLAGVHQGSGWCWLAYCKFADILVITTTQNQDPLEATQGFIPLLGIDVWEHAYYLQYKNARAEYLKAIWQVVNFSNVSERLEKAKSAYVGCK